MITKVTKYLEELDLKLGVTEIELSGPIKYCYKSGIMEVKAGEPLDDGSILISLSYQYQLVGGGETGHTIRHILKPDGSVSIL